MSPCNGEHESCISALAGNVALLRARTALLPEVASDSYLIHAKRQQIVYEHKVANMARPEVQTIKVNEAY